MRLENICFKIEYIHVHIYKSITFQNRIYSFTYNIYKSTFQNWIYSCTYIQEYISNPCDPKEDIRTTIFLFIPSLAIKRTLFFQFWFPFPFLILKNQRYLYIWFPTQQAITTPVWNRFSLQTLILIFLIPNKSYFCMKWKHKRVLKILECSIKEQT